MTPSRADSEEFLADILLKRVTRATNFSFPPHVRIALLKDITELRKAAEQNALCSHMYIRPGGGFTCDLVEGKPTK